MKRKELVRQLENEGLVERHESGWYRVTTEADVASAVNWMLLTQQYTTTLEVKNFLRNRGFWAIQADISRAMDKMYQAGVLDYLDNGTFRQYYYVM